mmetsp:Transcript_61813/g.102108  ORF Transcript_61813/g.102108 Transcript_61813/m.102108 type:complete len:201 (+) Transcript_61813:291-893(+)
MLIPRSRGFRSVTAQHVLAQRSSWQMTPKVQSVSWARVLPKWSLRTAARIGYRATRWLVSNLLSPRNLSHRGIKHSSSSLVRSRSNHPVPSCRRRCLKVQRPAKSARARGPRHASSRLQASRNASHAKELVGSGQRSPQRHTLQPTIRTRKPRTKALGRSIRSLVPVAKTRLTVTVPSAAIAVPVAAMEIVPGLPIMVTL